MLGSFDHVTRRLIVHTNPTKRSSDFVAHLEQLDQLYGPKPGQFTKPVVLVLDNGPIHTSKLSLAALASRAHWLTVEWLPKYAPELNDIEGVWRDLKAHHLAHQTFADADALNTAIHQAVDALGGFRREVQPRRQHWFLNEKSGFPFRTPAFCSVSRGQRRLGEDEYRAPSVTPGVALRPRTQAQSRANPASVGQAANLLLGALRLLHDGRFGFQGCRIALRPFKACGASVAFSSPGALLSQLSGL